MTSLYQLRTDSTTPSSLVPTITPASPSYFAIYNPGLGLTDATLEDQIVYHTTRKGVINTCNEKLRQVGLAQGIVEFAKGFSRGDRCTIVESQKSRFITIEVEEPGWWLLAQIELTFIHNPTALPPTSEYTAREVAPSHFLVAQLRKAYAQFRLRYGTFQSNWNRLERSVFLRRLEKYWNRWVWGKWEVILKGSPVADLLSETHLKMAGGQCGQGMHIKERRFFEGWATKEQSHGLVDMIIIRCGSKSIQDYKNSSREPSRNWFYSGKETSDSRSTNIAPINSSNTNSLGCIFKGVGKLDIMSVIDLSEYVSELYKGCELDPIGRRQIKIKTNQNPRHQSIANQSLAEVSARNSNPTLRPACGEICDNQPSLTGLSQIYASAPSTDDLVYHAPSSVSDSMVLQHTNPTSKIDTNYVNSRNVNLKIMNFITFGWTGRTRTGIAYSSTTPPNTGLQIAESQREIDHVKLNVNSEPHSKQTGRFLIGFQGDLNIQDLEDDHNTSSGRITSKSIWLLQRESCSENITENRNLVPAKSTIYEEFKLIAYSNSSIVFAFIFRPETDLNLPSFYRSLHFQFSPLALSMQSLPTAFFGKKTLKNISVATTEAIKPPYDLVLDSTHSCFYSTLPPIPEPGHDTLGWTRMDALHVYTILLAILLESPSSRCDYEKSVSSTRGWWINRMRSKNCDGIVVRRAGDRREAIGPDAIGIRKYFERLFSETVS